jgi:hypothetical protein
MAFQDELKKLVSELRAQRDELAVKIHLAGCDVRDEWDRLEKQLEHLRARAEVIGREASDAAGDVRTAARLVVDELEKGYARIRALV